MSRRYLFSSVSDAEHAIVTAKAKAAGVSVAQWLRYVINRELFEEDESQELLREPLQGRPKRAADAE
jgi:hypothetical protein